MRRKVFLFVALALVATLAFAQKSPPATGLTLTPPGSFLVNVGIGWPGASGGAEVIISQFKIADTIPLSFGVAGRGYVNFFWGLYFGGAGFGTLHFSWRSLGLPSELSFLNPIDTYIGLGAGFSTYSGIGIAEFSGIAYYLNDKLAISAEDGYIGGFAGYSDFFGTFGLTLKL